MIKYLPIICFSLLPFCLLSQKMFRTGEWCAESKQHNTVLPPNNLDGRSDSIDLTHAWVTLDMSGASTKTISGNCRWAFTPKISNVEKLRFDLLGLTVDSVILNNELAVFTQVGEAVNITISSSLPIGSINSVAIHYHGSPQKDGSGWGGFYFDGNYAFNLGVGFAADPHVFGRAWFPCFDNFEERSTYTFDIVTTPTQPAYCNGYMLTDEATPDGKRRRLWLLNQPIPSYLACVAIGPYTSFKRTYPGALNAIPVEIAAAAADTVKVRNTFQHLPAAIQAYEYWYGPYKWSKIGYSLVPFNSGAMEHATNIAIGRAYVDGSLNYETLWAHELSHHWWGDLATCSTAEDMWLNEGWASYSEHLFTEWQYGKQAFQSDVRSNFLNVLQNAHISEGGYLAVSGVPHSLTYGTHVYNKGAVVAHNLRGYMGDSLFRIGIRSALEATNFTDWSSAGFRDKLEVSTGVALHDFFDDWVYAGGYPDFLIDSVRWTLSGTGQHTANVYVKQKLRGATQFHQNVPLEFSFVEANGQKEYFTRLVSGENSVVTFDFAGTPNRQVMLNTNLRLLLARSDGEKMIKSPGTTNFTEAKMNITVNSMGVDSFLLRTEHHFANPDNAGANPNEYALSTRFWEVYLGGTATVDAQATITYDGRGQQDQLDTPLFASTGASEDSVLVLYRPGAGYPWLEWPTYIKIPLGSTNDKFGQLRILHLLPGQYAIGKGVSTVAAKEPFSAFGKISATPNPSTDMMLIQASEDFEQWQVISAGGVMMEESSFEKTRSKALSLQAFPAGQYWLILTGASRSASIPIVKF